MGQPCQVDELTVRAATPADRPAVDAVLLASWGSYFAAGHGALWDLRTLPTLIAGDGEGVLTYQVAGGLLEVVSIDAATPRRGVGTALLRAATEVGRSLGCRELWLVTTNDNLDALRFYQRRGMRITAVAPGAVAESRRLKPEIPIIGAYGIEIRDEITLSLSIE